MAEYWKDIPSYEGSYQASDLGRIRSLKGVLIGRESHGKILKPGSNSKGRLQVVLCKHGFTKRFQVHRLILLAFKGECPEGLEGCHNDGNHLNNHIFNLRWDTRASNKKDMVDHGTQAMGDSHPLRKLSSDDVAAIRSSQESQKELSERYAVTQACISNVIRRKTWNHIG